MTVRLRPHHLLCLLTYVGKGYSPAFTANYDAIAERISQGEDILVVEGPDDICAPLLSESDPHCWRDSVTERDRLAARDLRKQMADPIRAGARMTLDATLLRRMQAAFAAGHTRAACIGCQWRELCSSIAVNDFQGTILPGAR